MLIFWNPLNIFRTKGVVALVEGKVSRVDGYAFAALRLPVDQDQGVNMSVKLLGIPMVHGPEPDDILHASGEVGDPCQVPVLVHQGEHEVTQEEVEMMRIL